MEQEQIHTLSTIPKAFPVLWSYPFRVSDVFFVDERAPRGT